MNVTLAASFILSFMFLCRWLIIFQTRTTYRRSAETKVEELFVS